MRMKKNDIFKRIGVVLCALIVLLSAFVVRTFAAIPEEEQQFWSVFNYNYVYKNMGIAEFKTHWNKTRDEMPLVVNFGTQRVGYADNNLPAFSYSMFEYNRLGDFSTIQEGTYQQGFYMGHGNGLIYAGGNDVPDNYCYKGHMFQRNTLRVPTITFGGTTCVLTVELIFIKGDLTNWNQFDITEINLDAYTGDYQVLKREYYFEAFSTDSGDDGPYYRGSSDLMYRARVSGPITQWITLQDGDFYCFIFGQTAGSVWNEHQNGNFETLYYSWFNGETGIDEDTNGMTVQRFGMISPLFYEEGYNAFYQPIYDEGYFDGFGDGELVGQEYGYTNGHEVGYREGRAVGYSQGLKDGFDAADTSQAWANMKNLIFAIFDAPFYVISYSLNFDLFGINIAGTLIALISLAIVVFILKIILVKLF